LRLSDPTPVPARLATRSILCSHSAAMSFMQTSTLGTLWLPRTLSAQFSPAQPAALVHDTAETIGTAYPGGVDVADGGSCRIEGSGRSLPERPVGPVRVVAVRPAPRVSEPVSARPRRIRLRTQKPGEPVIVLSRSTPISCGDPRVSSAPRRRRRGHRTRPGASVTWAELGDDPPRYLLAGPDRASNLLELVALVLGGDELVIHAMGLRRMTAQELVRDE
jgi:hypothetical protein